MIPSLCLYLIAVWLILTVIVYIIIKKTGRGQMIENMVNTGVGELEQKYGTEEGTTGLGNIINKHRKKDNSGDKDA